MQWDVCAFVSMQPIQRGRRQSLQKASTRLKSEMWVAHNQESITDAEDSCEGRVNAD